MTSRNKPPNDQLQYQIILDQMQQDECNKKCADCWARNPIWASWNLGVFLCARCAGVHRSLGTHISKVKSVRLDLWTPEQIASMQAMGNAAAINRYEALIPDNYKHSRPDGSPQALERFIRDKYERKIYVDKNSPSSGQLKNVSSNNISQNINAYSGDARNSSTAAEQLPVVDVKPLIEF